jgi:uncharacterized protein YkwD
MSIKSRKNTARQIVNAVVITSVVTASGWLGAGVADASSPTASEASIAANVLSLLNSERAAHGLPALQSSAALITSARNHNAKMAQTNQLSHQLAGEAALGARISQVGVSWHAAAENIGWTTDRSVAGARSMENAMYQEKAPDDGHRLNILS